MTSYLWGLVTLPAVAFVGFVCYVLLEPAGDTFGECPRCHHKWYPGRSPWWVWEIRRRRIWADHMRRSHTCRERTNAWFDRQGSPQFWTPQGKLVER